MKKRNTKSSQAFRERNMAQRIAPVFPQEADQQAAHLGSQSQAPQGPLGPGDDGTPMGPTQDMSFGRTA